MSKLLALLEQTGAIYTNGHFVLTSGKHAAIYINKDALYPHTAAVSAVCEEFAAMAGGLAVDTVVGPALGGIILSQWTAHHLSKKMGRETVAVYTEKSPDGAQVFTRGYEKHVANRSVLVVEDIITTGGSVKKVIEAVLNAGGRVAAICAMVNRNPDEVSEASLGAPFHPLETFRVESYAEPQCPMCRSGVPVNTSVGHGRKYMAAKQTT